jgi:hypothetical protein
MDVLAVILVLALLGTVVLAAGAESRDGFTIDSQEHHS